MLLIALTVCTVMQAPSMKLMCFDGRAVSPKAVLDPATYVAASPRPKPKPVTAVPKK